MSTQNEADDRIDRLVDELFGAARYGEYFKNPVTVLVTCTVSSLSHHRRRRRVVRSSPASGSPLMVQPMRSRFPSGATRANS